MDLWDDNTRKEFDSRAKCMENQYSQINIPGTQLKIDGTKTLSENIADNAGTKAAFRAYKHYLEKNTDPRLNGYGNYTNEEMFFVSLGIV